MKKIILIGLTILVVMVGAFIAWAYSGDTNAGGVDVQKLLAMQAQQSGEEAPLINVEQRRVDIKFINKHDSVVSRPMRLYIPQGVLQPMPVVYIPHYEMKDDAAELRKYLAEGWMVVSPTDFDNAYNGMLTDDDLVFNNAALYTLRHMPEVDAQRIALVGGSAGGYMTLMLNVLQMGNCVSVANSPIANVYFNFNQYFKAASELNGKAMGKVALKGMVRMLFAKDENKMAAMLAPMMQLPIPFAGMVGGMFAPINDNFPDKDDVKRWEALSAVGMADCFSSPFVLTHVTSDVLVPVDQITRRFTHEQEGKTMPKGFSTRLPMNYPGVLSHSLEDELPEALTKVKHIVISDPNENTVLPYDAEFPFNINIYDDGPTESYASHRASTGTGVIDDVPYLRDKLAQTLAQTEILMPGKLRLLLERYQGNSIQLPAHEGIDDAIYGSLTIYQQEVVEELSRYVMNHSLKELENVAVEVTAQDKALADTWHVIKVLMMNNVQ
ncbi:MAG: alpha/beta hydrolase [Bacteroidales bacterium]